MKVLITGGAGFIGSHLAEYCIRKGHDVCILDNFTTGKLENVAHLQPNTKIIDGDIRNRETLSLCLRGVEAVFHLAAMVSVPESIEKPTETNSVNLTGTLNLLELCRYEDIKRFVFASSCAVYGSDKELPKREESLLDPLTPYALQKVTGEYYCKLFNSLYGLPTTSFRFFNIYGPRQDSSSPYSGVIAKFVENAIKGEPVSIYGDGKQTRDFIFVDDVCRLISSVVFNGEKINKRFIDGHSFNIGTGIPTSLDDLVSTISRILNRNIEVFHESKRAGDILHSYADNKALLRILKTDKKFKSLSIGLSKYIENFLI